MPTAPIRQARLVGTAYLQDSAPQTASLHPRLPKERALLVMNMRVSTGASDAGALLNITVPTCPGAKLGALAGRGDWEQQPRTPLHSKSYRWKKRRDVEPHCPSWRVLVPRRNGLNGPMPGNRDGDLV